MAKYSMTRQPRVGGAGSWVRERQQAEPLTVTATEAKTRFGPLLETAMGGRAVIITRHNTARAVLLSVAEFEALSGARPPGLDALTSEFDAVLTRMQTPASRKALTSAFGASPAELGRLAVAPTRRRG